MKIDIDFDKLQEETFNEMTKNLQDNWEDEFLKKFFEKSLKATKIFIEKYHQELLKD